VGSHKRKPVLVLIDLLDRHLPTFHGVALLTAGAELPLVNVSVAVCAFCAHVGEYQLGVALRARHALVHTAQRIAGLVVIELRHIADWFPSAESMAILAGDIQRPMRAARGGVVLR
jgi:hypothetical protein